MKIRKIEERDLETIAKIHKLAYRDDHFTSKFTLNMLKNFYLELIKNNSYCYLALDDDQKVTGFLIAGDKTQYAIDNFIKRNLIYLLTILIKNPSFFVEKIKSIIGRYKNAKKGVNTKKMRLLSVAIDPNEQRKGIGKALIKYLEDDLKIDKIEVYGCSVKKNNLKAIRFFEKNKFIVDRIDSHGIYYIKKIA